MDELPLKWICRNLQIASRIAVDWSNFCRDVCVHWDRNYNRNLVLRGEVEIDESFFYQRKHNRGRAAGRHKWVISIVERGSGRVCLERILNRSMHTMIPIKCGMGWRVGWVTPDSKFSHSQVFRNHKC